MTIGIFLLICWALGLFAFHVAGGLIHVLVILGLIAIVLHLVRGSKTAV
ncbi:MAG TPA: lmo0937 family membrane protein [Thermoanaerobaculia bacterium]